MMDRKGFTLIELLIVVVIIGILAAIAIPKFSATREKAYVSSMKADLRNLSTAQETFYVDNDYVYGAQAAITDGSLEFTQSEGVTVAIGGADNQGWNATAVHAALGTGTNIGCAIYYGSGPQAAASTPGGIAVDASGVIVCDDPNAPPAP